MYPIVVNCRIQFPNTTRTGSPQLPLSCAVRRTERNCYAYPCFVYESSQMFARPISSPYGGTAIFGEMVEQTMSYTVIYEGAIDQRYFPGHMLPVHETDQS